MDNIKTDQDVSTALNVITDSGLSEEDKKMLSSTIASGGLPFAKMFLTLFAKDTANLPYFAKNVKRKVSALEDTTQFSSIVADEFALL